MQSKNYVSGVSGWKLHLDSGRLEVEGVIRAGGLDDGVHAPKPFIVVDGVTYISQSEVEALKKVEAKIAAMRVVKAELLNLGYVCAGLGIGLGDTVIVTEVSARASADEAISSRIGALEARMGSLAAEALAIKGDIDAAAALNRK